MKTIYKILLFAAVVCVGAVASSCSKDDSAGDNSLKYTLLELDFTTALTRAISAEQGNTITDVTVWAYEITVSGNTLQVQNGGKPVGWATKSYTSTTGSTTSSPMRMELPYSDDDKKYRLFAVVNKDAFGTIYTPMNDGQQTQINTISSEVTYKELSTYVFEATTDMMGDSPTTTPTLPVSHWVDVTITGGTSDASPYPISMNVYRALGKASLVASMDANSSNGAQLKITGVKIGARTSSYTVAQQGFMFSDVAEVNNLTSPSAFGTLQDIERGVFTEVGLTPADVTLTKSDSQNKFIAAKFLYENHHTGATGVIADANAAGDGQYYMEITYEYGPTTDFETKKQSDTGYVALPAIVRNHNAQVNATFTVDLQGAVTLSCTVADWVQDETLYGSNGDTQGEANLTFNYPTYSVMAFDRDASNNEVFNKPTVTKSPAKTFTMLFQMTGPEYTNDSNDNNDIFWKPTLTAYTGTDLVHFSLKVYAATINNDGSVTLGADQNYGTYVDKFAASSQWYAIEIGLQAAAEDAPTTDKQVELRIVYNAPWLGTGVNESMLINGSSSPTKWPDSGGDPHYIVITQEAVTTP